jgi:hypothetical protein
MDCRINVDADREAPAVCVGVYQILSQQSDLISVDENC